MRCLAWNGRLLIAGFAAGSIPSHAANRVLLKGASVIGVRAEAMRRLADRQAIGRIAIHVDTTQ
ncbi:MAG: hypothetical protein K2X43_07125 [Hyphomonadaceae bacterium]|jgi:NADPH2:quinone reductase|nr:hypothetical protein [Hyphomonadaceae bacterium]